MYVVQTMSYDKLFKKSFVHKIQDNFLVSLQQQDWYRWKVETPNFPVSIGQTTYGRQYLCYFQAQGAEECHTLQLHRHQSMYLPKIYVTKETADFS